MSKTHAAVRRRLDQHMKNPRCEANTRSALLDVPMRHVARDEGAAPTEGQSPFAVGRGVKFEQTLFADEARSLRVELARVGVIPSESVRVFDARTTANGGSLASLEEARARFVEWLGACHRPEHGVPTLWLGPSVHAPAREAVGEGLLTLDFLVALTADAPGSFVLRVGEVKVFPHRGGHTDVGDLASTRRQAGLYLFALREELRALGASRTRADERGIFVLSSAGTNRPAVRADELLEFQARTAARAIEQLTEASRALHATLAEQGPAMHEPKRRLEFVREAPTHYAEGCLAFCPRAKVCHDRACALGQPVSLGDDVAAVANDTEVARVVALSLHGASPANPAESALVERLAAVRLALG